VSAHFSGVLVRWLAGSFDFFSVDMYDEKKQMCLQMR
jgi:hypothetical protein